jgi:hypothetical protein
LISRFAAAETATRISQQHVFGDGEAFHQLEVLVNHADAVLHGVARANKPAGHAGDLDRARIRRIEAGGHVHQRRFTGAVFAQKRVNLAVFDAQMRVVEREEIAEGFRDAAELKRRRHISRTSASSGRRRCAARCCRY